MMIWLTVVVPFVVTYLLCAGIAVALFVQRVVQDPHVYSRLEWTNVATSFAATICLVPASIVIGALRDGQQTTSIRDAK